MPTTLSSNPLPEKQYRRELNYSLRLRSPQWIQNLSIALVAVGVVLYLAVGTTSFNPIISRIGFYMLLLGIVISVLFSFSTKRLQLVINQQGQQLKIPDGKDWISFAIQGSRFCWAYNEVVSAKVLGSARTISQLSLNIDLLTTDNRRILITSSLPAIKNKPADWPFIRLPDSGQYDAQIFVAGGLQTMKKQLEQPMG